MASLLAGKPLMGGLKLQRSAKMAVPAVAVPRVATAAAARVGLKVRPPSGNGLDCSLRLPDSHL